jgi:hypothetical protein
LPPPVSPGFVQYWFWRSWWLKFMPVSMTATVTPVPIVVF